MAAPSLEPARFGVPVDARAVCEDWRARGFSCDPFTDPPGRSWRDYVHDLDELVTVLEGRLEVEMNGETWVLAPGDELFIPRGMVHSVTNIHSGTTRWLYGYG